MVKVGGKESRHTTYGQALADIRGLISDGRHEVVRAINTTMTATYWLIGRRIFEEEQRGAARAGYGDELILRLARDLSRRCGRGFGARNLCIPVPFYHCFGMVLGNLACTSHGAAMIIPGEGFDATLALEAVAAERCTALYGVPTMFIAELEHPRFADFDLRSLRTGIMAGSPCPIETMRQVQTRMTVTGKVQKFRMREVAIAELALADAAAIETA
jgi:acyl-CoA synthetase (AMP-forming)/AMP-acid ligase II